MYPAYRKYTNSEVYFKIISESEFEEISFIGSKGILYNIKAKQFPEKLRIQDMLSCKDNVWQQIDSEIYETKKALT